MARQCYKMNLNGVDYKLRLTLTGQKALVQRDPESNILAIIMGAAEDIDTMEALLTEALNWEGNTNKIHSGAEFYDELVDAGYAGTEDFMKVSLNIAKNAGIINQDNRDKLERVTSRMFQKSIDMMLEGMEGAVEPENPTMEAQENHEMEPKVLS